MFDITKLVLGAIRMLTVTAAKELLFGLLSVVAMLAVLLMLAPLLYGVVLIGSLIKKLNFL